MSLVFNDTTNQKGIVQIYEKECGFPVGTVSGSTTLLQQLAADVNLAFDDFVEMALQSDGRWEFDDSNQADYPIIMTNLVSGQRDYAFTTDSSGNLILEVFKVFAATSTGIYFELVPVDVGTESTRYPGVPASGQLYYAAGLSSFTDGQNLQGTPTRYDKRGNGIFLDPIPNYNFTNGLKVYVNRTPSYFTSSDTTKSPGVPGIFHRYFAIKPASDYARRNQLANAPALALELQKLEGAPGQTGKISEYFSSRSRDRHPRITVSYQDNR